MIAGNRACSIPTQPIHPTITSQTSPHYAETLVVQVRPSGLVELQRAGEGLQHVVGDATEIAALEAGVVVDAHPGEQRDLLPTQPGHPPVAAERGQAGLPGVIRERREARNSRISVLWSMASKV